MNPVDLDDMIAAVARLRAARLAHSLDVMAKAMRRKPNLKRAACSSSSHLAMRDRFVVTLMRLSK